MLNLCMLKDYCTSLEMRNFLQHICDTHGRGYIIFFTVSIKDAAVE